MEAAPAMLPDNPVVTPRQELEQQFEQCGLVRPFRRACYDPGQILRLSVTGVTPARPGRVEAEVERFVGGGFAGQVYRVTLRSVTPEGDELVGLEVGQPYAIKILKPPSGFACLFRNFLYFLAYQGSFSAQVNPASVRVGVLWQKLIRRAAAQRFGRKNAICDTYATFYDAELHSFGEINEWVDGRIWKFEVDNQLFDRWRFKGPPPATVRSAEYVHKKLFMDELVRLLHEMGAPELARQYEWWTCKSQPNTLKRVNAEDSPSDGLTAIDFRAGLALLPFLPMSPADVPLILRGLLRGRLVQFDRSDPKVFENFIARHHDDFADLQPVIDELREKETEHRRGLPDITHHHVRLLTDGQLRKSVRAGAVTAWHSLDRIDDKHAARLRTRPLLFSVLWLVALIPLLGPAVLKLWGHARKREHLRRMITSGRYLWRAWRGARIETLVRWHRQGRVTDERARKLVNRPVRFWVQRILVGWMPATWHRAFTEPSFAWERLRARVAFVYNMLRHPVFREEWLLEQVRLGQQEGMLTDAEARKIALQVKDPYIQKYLKCLAVHICTVPITQIVMVVVGLAVGAYALLSRDATWGEAVLAGTAAGALIQLLPVSPGSIARGLFVLYLMVRERDIKNYYIAAPVSFIHVIGYLAFPLQMVAHDPALARFLAGRWAKSAVRVVPVFGERGALLEHSIFDTFFNLPLSVSRRLKSQPWKTSLLFGAMAAALAYPAAVILHLLYAVYVNVRG